MLAPADLGALGPTTWADLGCGEGTFTRALASLLAPGSTVHAMDRDASALPSLPSVQGPAMIRTHAGDFTRRPWAFPDVDGILMANALHYVGDQLAFIRACAAQAAGPPHFLVVEYDTDRGNQWVPYPVSRARLASLFADAGYGPIRLLGTRRSIYRTAPLYAAAIAPGPAHGAGT